MLRALAPMFTPIHGSRGRVTALLLGLLVLSACDEPVEAPDNDPQDRRRSSVVEDVGRAIDPELPHDVRLLGIEPALHVGQERVCDVGIAGRAQRLNVADRQAYESKPAARLLIQCKTPAGEGWADLVFAPAAASLVGNVTTGERIRVRVLAADGGFEDKPIIEFIAVLGDLPVHEPERRDFLALHAGYDFREIDSDDVGKERDCAITYITAPERLPATSGYPGHPSSHAMIVCRHAQGDSWVDVGFSESEAEVFLTLRPGLVVTMRILAAEGGDADLPIVRFVGIVPPTSH